MNKTKMILAGTGGAIGLIVLVLAFLVWQAFSAKTAASEGDEEEGTEGLETVLSKAQNLLRKPVYPSAQSVEAIEKSRAAVEEWCEEGLSLASKGDRMYEKTTAPKFKTFLVADAGRIAALPGAVSGKLVKPDFAFGPFKDYIVGGKMPSEAELAELQRKWDDVATVAELFSTNGVAELLDVSFAEAKGEAEAEKNAAGSKSGRGKRPQRGGNGKPAAAGSTSLVPQPSSFSYVFTFSARPAAFIRTLNALASNERFVVAEEFTFSRPSDVIAETLGADEKKAAEQKAPAATARRGRGGRRGNVEAASKPLEKDEEAPVKGGLVTDPLQDAPLTVTLKVTICDFRSLVSKEGADSGSAGKDGQGATSPLKKGASK